MKAISVKQYMALGTALRQEKARLEARLKEINAALGSVSAVPSAAVATAPRGPKQRAARAVNALSLREAVAKVVEGKTLTKEEILKGVQGIGYKFTASNPMLSLNTLLYTPGNFKKHPGGKWGPFKK